MLRDEFVARVSHLQGKDLCCSEGHGGGRFFKGGRDNSLGFLRLAWLVGGVSKETIDKIVEKKLVSSQNVQDTQRDVFDFRQINAQSDH